MTKKAPTMLLSAEFDMSQVSGTLDWSFTRKDGNGHPITGKYAGGIYFTVGEEMRVVVRALSWNRLVSFKVLDCTLITIPQIVELEPKKTAKFAPCSPFISTATPHVNVLGASINLPGDGFKKADVPAPPPGAPHEIALQWDKHLTVGSKEGRWEMSFVITVEVQEGDGPPVQRVFCFDPESEVGNGITPPR